MDGGLCDPTCHQTGPTSRPIVGPSYGVTMISDPTLAKLLYNTPEPKSLMIQKEQNDSSPGISFTMAIEQLKINKLKLTSELNESNDRARRRRDSSNRPKKKRLDQI